MRRQLLCFIVLSCGQVLGQPPPCNWPTCHECISDPNICAWCSSEEFTFDSRCRLVSKTANESWCPQDHIQNPKSNITTVVSLDFNSTLGHIIQLKPQQYRLDIRVGEPKVFNFTYKAAENFPVDIYFLLDTSLSLVSVKEALQKQSTNIFKTMRNLTKDVYMGLGTFIEKNMIPYTNNVKANLTYSFKHQLSLTDNITGFTSVLAGITFGTNNDPPESGLDGIAQVIACKSRINWRNESTKILVYITDESFHSAGDGLYAGIFQPYDGGCYLDDEGFYEMEKEMDYPSVGIINKMAAEEQITIIFNSRGKDDLIYDNLKSAVDNSRSATADKRIEEHLKEIYESISKNIVLRVNISSQHQNYFNISFEPNCWKIGNDDDDDVKACTVEKGKEKQFTGTITMLKYFGVDHLSLGINPKGLKEDIGLDINVISGCGCDEKKEKNSSTCSRAGDLSCGVCECYEYKHGKFCGCLEDRSECKRNDTDVECSDQGRCFCGACNCNVGYGGKYCQVNTGNCPRNKNGMCSGHGQCRDGDCTCDEGWSGKDCACSESACRDLKMDCNNRGHCRCGKCQCYNLSKWDVRSYEEASCSQAPCHECHYWQCRKLIPCVTCHSDSDQCADSCGGNITVIKAPEVLEEMRSERNVCSNIRIEFGCYLNFSYTYNTDHTITLFAVNKKNCQENQIVIGVISAFVLICIGLLTLLAWKVLTTIRDRREYQQFVKGMEATECEEYNEVYRAPTTTYLNPAFQTTPDDKDDIS